MLTTYILFFLFCPTHVFAYLDPGTGSMLIYALIGVITSLFFIFKDFFYKAKNFFLSDSKTIDTSNYNIVIHSEGKRYFDVFERLITEFIKNNYPIVYITPDKNDPACEIKDKNLKVICTGSEIKCISLMNNLKANIVISTTPHLDIYQWKRSKNVKEYVHIFHSPTSIDFYEMYALSFYDTIFTVVDITREAQQYLDNKRNLPQKKYYKVGCPYFDKMILEKTDKANKENIILYAPSWGARSSLHTIGIKIIDKLIELKYHIIFRPHPQSFISDKNVIQNIKNKYDKNLFFQIDNTPSPIQSMNKCDALITDVSGIMFDFYVLHNKKPILLASDNINRQGYEIENLPLELQFDCVFNEKIAYKLNENNLNEIDVLLQKESPNILNSSIYTNIGDCSKVIYEQIRILESKIL